MTVKLTPSPFLSGVTAYKTPMTATPVDLLLNGNEGAPPPSAVLEEALRAGVETVRLYPHNQPVEERLADLLEIDVDRLVVTAGADDALARIMRAVLAPGREMVMPVPTFEMIERYVTLSGGELRPVPWLEGPLPVEAILEQVNEKTAIITVVTPNSPIGQSATDDELETLSDAIPDGLLLVDLAYTDFADNDLTSFVLSLPNAVITRTLSKAWGLAGLRVGFAAGSPEVMSWLRAAGQPYAVSSLSLAVANKRLETGQQEVRQFVSRVREERLVLVEVLRGLPDVKTWPSQGNFVFARFKDATWVRDGMAGLGIAVRAFPGKPYLEDGMRITVPGNETDFNRLIHGFRTVLDPEAILFDMDDTLADVTASYRLATVATAKAYGVAITFDEITAAKAEGDANNDWVLTRRMLAERGVAVSLEDVTQTFEDFYQGKGDRPGYKTKETLLCDRALLERLASRVPLGVVTGRPRSDAEEFLVNQGIRDLFEVVVTMDDGPVKPDPAPVMIALQRLGIERAWMVGDTPDDMRSARGAAVVPIGVVAPADDAKIATRALLTSGAGRVIESLSNLEELLP